MPHAFTATGLIAAQAAGVALLESGLTPTFLPLALCQLAFETNGFQSRVMAENNNLSGIKYVGQKNATQGLLSPEGNYYASFATIDDWAADYIRIISRGSAPPIDASNAADLAQRLKANGYYTDTVANYAGGLAAWLVAAQGISITAKKKAHE